MPTTEPEKPVRIRTQTRLASVFEFHFRQLSDGTEPALFRSHRLDQRVSVDDRKSSVSTESA